MRIVVCKECGKENLLATGEKYEKCEYCGTPPTSSGTASRRMLIGISATVISLVIVLAVTLIYLFTVHNVTVDDVRYQKKGNSYIVASQSVDLKGEVEIKSKVKGKAVTAISSEAFTGTRVTSVIIPASVKNIGEKAFSNCDTLETVTMNVGLEKIGKYAFYHCDNLVSATLPSGVKEIGDSAFYGCTRLDNVVIPSTVKAIGSTAFSRCAMLSNLVIENGVKSIGYAAFEECTRLAEVTLPDSVESIGMRAFYRCSIMRILNIGSGIISIGESVLEECVNLEVINYKGTENNWSLVTKGDYWRKNAGEFTVNYVA